MAHRASRAAAAPYPVDIAALAKRFSRVFPHLDDRSGGVNPAALAIALYRLLGRGAPVAWDELAAAGGLQPEDARRIVSDWPAVVEEQGRIVAFGGLCLRPVSRHRLLAGGRELYARCAWDTLFLPAALGETLRVHSVCEVTGAAVRLTVAPHGVLDHAPAGLRLSMLEPRADMRDDLPQHF